MVLFYYNSINIINVADGCLFLNHAKPATNKFNFFPSKLKKQVKIFFPFNSFPG